MKSLRFSRRSFLETVGLGAGAQVLGGVANSLFAEAMGAVTPRKRVIVFLHGNGLSHDFNLTPPEMRARDTKLITPIVDGPKDYTWPAMLQALAPHRTRMLLIDGLANQVGKSQHSAGYAALSCFTSANSGVNEYGGPPGNITIDQFLADKLSNGQPVKSVLYGITKDGGDYVHTVISASGVEKPEPHFMSPTLLYNTLFGTLLADGNGVRRGAVRQAKVLDALRSDIKKLQGALAGSEKRKLDHYASALEEFDKRQQAIGALTCTAGTPPSAVKGTVEDRLDSMTEMAVLALTCGMTSVVGISAGCGMSHQMFPGYQRIAKGTQFESAGQVEGYGHEQREVQGPAMDIIHNYHAGVMKRFIDALSAVKEGNGTAWDNTVIVYASDNGEAHHSAKDRWPLVVIGNAGGALKSDGRFIRFPIKNQAASYRSLADFYCTLAHAVGVPTDTFGMGGVEPVKGPIAELMA